MICCNARRNLLFSNCPGVVTRMASLVTPNVTLSPPFEVCFPTRFCFLIPHPVCCCFPHHPCDCAELLISALLILQIWGSWRDASKDELAICLCLGFCIPYFGSPLHPCPCCSFSARCHFYPPHTSQGSCYLWLVEQNQTTQAGSWPAGEYPSMGALEKAFCLMMGSLTSSPVSCPSWPPLASYQ